MTNNNHLYKIWFAVLGIGIMAGLVTMYRVFTVGHVIYNANDVLIWTLPLANYIFFALTSTGLAIVASASIVFGIKRFEPLAKRSIFLAIATLFAAFVSLLMELGTPLNIINYLITPNLTSTIWWMGVLYTFYLILLLITFSRMMVNKPAMIPGLFMFLFAISATPTLGATIGLVESRPAFFGAFMPAYFILTAILSGLGAIIFVTLVHYHFSRGGIPEKHLPLCDELGKIFGFLVGSTIFFFAWRTIVGLYASSPGFIAFDYIVRSVPYHFELWLGLVVPFILMVRPALRRTYSGMIAASFLVLVGMFSSRMELLLEGVATPLGPRAVGLPEFVTYFPNTWEWLVVIFSLSVGLLIYTLGEKYLKLEGASE